MSKSTHLSKPAKREPTSKDKVANQTGFGSRDTEAKRIIASNIDKEKTVSMRLRESEMLLKIEEDEAKKRQVEAGKTTKRGPAKEKKLGQKSTQAILPAKREPRSKDKVAKQTGFGSRIKTKTG